MEYIKSQTLAYNLHFIKTNNFKRIYFKINFKTPLTKEAITYGNILVDILSNSSEKYPKTRDISLKLEDLYLAVLRTRNAQIGKDEVFSFMGSFLRDEYTEAGNEEEMMKFLNEVMFKPSISNGGFKPDTFKLAKEKLKEAIITKNENPSTLASNRFSEEFYFDTIAKYTSPGYIEDLESATEKNVYEFYQNILRSGIVDIFICGNVDIPKYEEWFKKYFPVNTVKKTQSSPIVIHQKFRKRAKIIKDQRDVKQCILKIGVKFDNLSDYERKYIAPLYAYILGGGSDSLMFQILREKNSLCYYCSASFISTRNSLVMKAGINYENIKKAINLIKILMKDIEAGKFDDDKISKFQIIAKATRKEFFDSAGDLIGLYQSKEYFGTDIGDEHDENLAKLTKKMIMDFAKKVKIDTIYTLEGVDCDE